MKIELGKPYHFVITKEMFNEITDYAEKTKLDISKTLRLIINKMLPLLDYYQFFQKESDNFGYIEIGTEINIKFKIEPEIFRKLKNLQGTMHAFSVAVIVRKMITLFFKYLNCKGLKWLENKMNRIKNKINKIMLKTQKYTKIQTSVIHMYGEEMMEKYISAVFSKNYTLLSVGYI